MRQPQGTAASPGQLTIALRELRDRTGLSLAALAARTPYSKSAWHRYLTGAKHPPRSAVEALARLAGADPAPALTLWDTGGTSPSAVAGSESGSGPESQPVPDSGADSGPEHGPDSGPEHGCDPDPDPGPRPGSEPKSGSGPAGPPRSRVGRVLLLTALTLPAAATATAAVLLAHSPGRPPDARVVMESPRCHGASCQGALPDASACAGDARTQSSVDGATYTVRLRYSPTCRTAWSQLRVRKAVAREISVRMGGNVLSATYAADDTLSDTSPMLNVSSPRGVEACAEVEGRLACTGLDPDAPDHP
ncbi:DUF2690 domain-containing protein [Streptomyces sp. NPDC052043]|uniref:helix-turn-helix domain-containing protein n=1 Tax=Streptomyces sp. NPDC052043 TaxID=3365684 RepID=UPI0037D16C9B